jgi:hypothetical protein
MILDRDWIRVGPAAMAVYWRVFAELGPRHRNVAHWVRDLGWRVDPSVVKAYLLGNRRGEGAK